MVILMLIGLVGKPSSGKSTFFKAATLADVLIAAYPFATIKPNHGIAYVRVECIDKEFKVKCNPRTGYCVNGIRFVPIDLMDVAGLVEGASEGRGLGNKFLDDLTSADAFIHLVDVSGETDSGGREGKGDPILDIGMLENELDLWYLGILKKVWKNFAKTMQSTKQEFAKSVANQFSGLKVVEEDIKVVLRKGNYDSEKPASWSDEDLKKFAHDLRHITKPMIIAANKSDRPDSKSNINKIKERYHDLIIIPCSADSELALREAGKAGLIDYIPGSDNFTLKGKLNERQINALDQIKRNVLEVYGNTGVQQVLDKIIFEILNYIAVFPAGDKLADSKGNILPDCFLVKNGSTALDFAFAVHSDLGKNFIKAIDARTKKTIGKEHKLKHRDGLEIVT